MGKKKELGKGIRALLADIESQETEVKGKAIKKLSSTIEKIPVDNIEINPFQPRTAFDSNNLKELSESIASLGIIQPLTVRSMGDGNFQIISGERRFRAAKLAGLNEVPVYIRVADDQAMLEMALVENIQREDLNALEVGLSFQRLIQECNLTQEELSPRVGKNRSTISNYIRLLKLPPEIQNGIRNQLISMGHARSLAGITDPIQQMSLFKKAVLEQWSVRHLENIIKGKSAGTNAIIKKIDPYLREAENRLSESLNSAVKIQQDSKGRGKIVIAFQDNEELNELLDKIRRE
jgi:ParB family chromosome partitioning protein